MFRKPKGKKREKLKDIQVRDNCWIKVPEGKGRHGIQILGERAWLDIGRDIFASEAEVNIGYWQFGGL